MNKTLYIMVGAPGSGKTWCATHRLMPSASDPNWKYISRDEVRFSLIGDDDDYFSKEDLVFNTFCKRIEEALNSDGVLNVIADATHLNWPSRRKLLYGIKQLNHPTVDVIPVVIRSDLQDALDRNNQRTGKSCVPESALRRMFKSMTHPEDDPYVYTKVLYLDNNY